MLSCGLTFGKFDRENGDLLTCNLTFELILVTKSGFRPMNTGVRSYEINSIYS